MQTLSYKPNLDETLDRLRSLYNRQAPGRIFASMSVPNRALDQFARDHAPGYCDPPEASQRIEFWDRMLQERTAVEDDSVPSAYLSELDQGLYGGLLGGHVQFMAHPENGWISSMVAPLLDDWEGFDSLVFDRTHPWFQRYLAQLDTFLAGSAGRFGLSHFILIDGLNFAFELLGATETYLGLSQRPEMIGRVIDFALDLNIAIHETFFQRVGLFRGGSFSNMVQWIPGRIVSESVDPFHMTSVEDLERWGRRPIEKILGHFDGGVVHIHGNGRHLLEAVCTLRGLKAMFLGDDRGFPLAFDILKELRARTGDLPLVVQTDYGRFIDALDAAGLSGGVFYQVSNVPDVDTANRLMERVRAVRT